MTIVPAHARAGDHQMVRDVAQILEQREENILIVHLGNSSGVDADIVSSRLLNKVTAEFGQQIPTLADFLVDADVTANQTIGRTTDGAHLVNGGQYDEELIFSQRMSEYMAHISGEYSIVLVHGMDMAETTNVEMLAGHSQGIIFLHDRTDLLSGDIRRTMDNLCEIQAPLFGIAMRPSQPTFFQRRRSARAAARQSKVDAGKVGNQRARKSVDHEMSGTVKPANELASVVANEINVVENGKELP